MMEVLLLQDIPGVGKKNDLIVVREGYALNNLLPRRSALVATPLVRRRYAEFIKRRAEEREREKAAVADIVGTIQNKTVRTMAKASKAGKLYAAVSESDIVNLLKEQLGVSLSSDAIQVDDPIKSTGTFQAAVRMGDHSIPFSVVVDAEKEEKTKAKSKSAKAK